MHQAIERTLRPRLWERRVLEYPRDIYEWGWGVACQTRPGRGCKVVGQKCSHRACSAVWSKPDIWAVAVSYCQCNVVQRISLYRLTNTHNKHTKCEPCTDNSTHFRLWKVVLDTVVSGNWHTPDGTRTHDPSFTCRVMWALNYGGVILFDSWFSILAVVILISLFVKVDTRNADRGQATASIFFCEQLFLIQLKYFKWK